jgi:cell division protein ZipA
MEADILRIILFLAGAALILGIYLADRFKRREADRPRTISDLEETEENAPSEEIYQRAPIWQESEEEAIDEPLVYGESALQEPAYQETTHADLPIVRDTPQQEAPPREEPVFTEPAYAEHEEAPQAYAEEQEEPVEVEPLADEPVEEEQVEEELKRLGDLINEERSEKPAEEKPESRSQQFSFRFFGGDAREAAKEPEEVDLPQKILQINIVPNEGRFTGDDILCAVSDVKLEFGDWEIYHSFDPTSESEQPIFSLASMVEPGSFPLERMEAYSTPGLTLFARLPGPKDGLTTFSELLFTAERLATLLEGTLQDETHSDLSKQTIEHMREEIQEYHRQLQLARSR